MEMLRRVLPAGTVMPGVRTELHDSGLTFGRQIATYPVLVGIPGLLPLKEVCDVKVVGHGFRSITAVPWPLDVNSAPAKTLESLPGWERSAPWPSSGGGRTVMPGTSRKTWTTRFWPAGSPNISSTASRGCCDWPAYKMNINKKDINESSFHDLLNHLPYVL